MYTFVLAPDSFKESMTAIEACHAMERGVHNVMPEANCIKVPMSDGGEGFVQALINSAGGRTYSCVVCGPLGTKVEAEYGILKDEKTAVLEMASASGIQLVPRERRNPFVTTTFGTGQLIKAALSHDIDELIIGVGGSATNDGGAGMAQALGVLLLDKSGTQISFGGGQLHKINTIQIKDIDKRLRNIRIKIACDVTNPLTGKNGASYIYGKQKGATDEMILLLDNNLKYYAGRIRQFVGKEVEYRESSGAGGGLAAGLLAFTEAQFCKGVEVIAEYSLLGEKIKNADFVFTGEGSLDEQTYAGKTVYGVISVSKMYNKPVICFAGKIGRIENLYENGLKSAFCISNGMTDIEQLLSNGQQNLEKVIENVVRLIKAQSEYE